MSKIAPGLRPEEDMNEHRDSLPALVVYDPDENFARRCRICYKEARRLVNPCRCNMEYHQHCLLKYIKGRLIAMGSEVDFSRIRCRHCNDQIRFLSHQNTQYGCTYFAAKMRRNWCSKTLTIILFLLVAIIVIGVIIAIAIDADTAAYFAMIVVEGVLGVVELGLIMTFIYHNLMYHEVILVKVYQAHEVMRPTHSSSEDDNQINHANIEIVINENY